MGFSRKANEFLRATMSGRIYEGVLAVHKPQGITSADVIRKLQSHFQPSETFAPYLESEREKRALNAHRDRKSQRKRRFKKQKDEVKLGHGGTLDPLATGVLVTGVGRGTKSLGSFLECTKTYEAVVLFGAETDSYDRVGKIVRRAGYAHITREMVEGALRKFRGKIMQHPPIFSALKVQGKKLYEYAREGVLPPIDIKPRPVEVVNLEILEWFEPGTHDFKGPKEEAPEEEKAAAQKLLEKDDALPVAPAQEGGQAETTLKVEEGSSSTKRKSPPQDSPQPEDAEAESTKKQKVSADSSDAAQPAPKTEKDTQIDPSASTKPKTQSTNSSPHPQSPAVRITMTVSSGFYVRALAHDLAKAIGTCGFMSELIRTRQGDYELDPEKILEYKDLDAGEEVWGPKVQRFLTEWEEKIREKEGRFGTYDHSD